MISWDSFGKVSTQLHDQLQLNCKKIGVHALVSMHSNNFFLVLEHFEPSMIQVISALPEKKKLLGAVGRSCSHEIIPGPQCCGHLHSFSHKYDTAGVWVAGWDCHGLELQAKNESLAILGPQGREQLSAPHNSIDHQETCRN